MPNENITVTHDGNTTTYTILSAAKLAVKAVGDWELDILVIPFGGKDSDGQYFDASTEIMEDAYSTPLVIYQHGVKQGAKGLEDRPQVIGRSVPGTLRKLSDGWHIRAVLNKAMKAAKEVMDAAIRGVVAVSSDSIAHLARLDIGGKLIPYEKQRAGRIAVWPLAGYSLWEKGNGNFLPASHMAFALPVMKAMYREAGLPFPEIQSKPTDGALSEADEAAKRARREEILNKTKTYLQKVGKEY